MLERIAATITRHAMFEPGMRVGVALSGGADSVCLLDVLHRLAPRWALELTVLHLNHHLRGEESAEDARFAARLAAERGLPFVVASADLACPPENLEQAARQARLDFFQEQATALGLQRIATGHTASDQAETVLFRFLRGSGPGGLAGILPVTREGLVRPLLDVTRDAVRAYLSEQGIAWREDSSNRSSEFARNRIRQTLLPGLIADWNPALEQILGQVAALSRDEEAYWEVEIERLFQIGFERREAFLIHSLERSRPLGPAVQRRLFRRAMLEIRGHLRQIVFEHVERLLELSASSEGHGRVILPGVDVVRSFDWLRFGIPGAEDNQWRNWRRDAPVPGVVEIPGGQFSLTLQLIRKGDHPVNEGYNESRGYALDWASLTEPLAIRNWRPGDEFCPEDRKTHQKLKSLFQQYRIPLWERRNWPILLSGEEIAWTAQFGVAEKFSVRESTVAQLQLQERRRPNRESDRSNRASE